MVTPESKTERTKIVALFKQIASGNPYFFLGLKEQQFQIMGSSPYAVFPYDTIKKYSNPLLSLTSDDMYSTKNRPSLTRGQSPCYDQDLTFADCDGIKKRQQYFACEMPLLKQPCFTF